MSWHDLNSDSELPRTHLIGQQMQEEKTVAAYVVDDDSSMINLMAVFLNTNGISTRAFSSGRRCDETGGDYGKAVFGRQTFLGSSRI